MKVSLLLFPVAALCILPLTSFAGTECGKNTATGEEQCILVQQPAPLREPGAATPASPADAASLKKLEKIQKEIEAQRKRTHVKGVSPAVSAPAPASAEEDDGPSLWQ